MMHAIGLYNVVAADSCDATYKLNISSLARAARRAALAVHLNHSTKP